MKVQVLTPNPYAYYTHYEYVNGVAVPHVVQCWPNYCLEYVQSPFGNTNPYLKQPTAAKAFEVSPTKHFDRNWPELWFCIWFTVKGVPAGHVAIHAPDHSIYSSSSSTSTTPVHHPNLEEMISYWGGPVNDRKLKYVAWTEDLEGVTIIKEGASEMNIENARTIVQRNYYLITGVDPSQAQIDLWAPQLVEDPNLVDNMMDQIAETPEGQAFQYKGHHYEQDVAAAGEKKEMIVVAVDDKGKASLWRDK